LYCPHHERTVERTEIVRGYRLNGYVVMEDADFQAVEQATSRVIEVLEFVELASVDPASCPHHPRHAARRPGAGTYAGVGA
jgi:DNA end-binding protein Ku